MKKIFSILFALALVVSIGLVTTTPVSADGTIINVPGDYLTIQEAIDDASDGDTIMVAAGLYEENVVIDKSLTLKGAQAGVDARTRSGSETIVKPDEEETGISIITAEGLVVEIDGLTVQNGAHGIATPEPTMAADITVKNVRVLNPSEFGISLTFTMETTVEYCYVENADIAINAGALEPFPPTVATFRNNEVVNSDFGITGYFEDSIIEGNLVRDFADGGIGISGQFLNTQLKYNTVTGYIEGAGLSFEEHVYRPLSDNVNVEGNTFTENSIGVYVFDTQTELEGITVNFNNFDDNSWYGVRNDASETLDATRNWWGANDGPRHAGPGGSGDFISANVDFQPWLGAALVTLQTETVTDDTVDASDEADTEVIVTGTATVTVAQLADNPGGDTPSGFGALGKYIDVYVLDTIEVTEIEIRLYYTDAEANDFDEQSLQLFWWNDTEWVQCSDSGVNTDSTNGYSGYMWAKIRDDTVPSLTDLQGTPFGGYGHPSQPPQPWPCFIATVAYGTDRAKEIDILRELRDEILLPNSLGARFVSLYYQISPPIAGFISQHEVIRTAVRVGFVDPIVVILNWSHDLWSVRDSL